MALTDNLISYWKLDETSGTRADAVVATGNDLTDNNTVTSNPGKIGNAGQFTFANTEYLSHADNASLSAGDIDISFAGWMYLDSKATYQVLLSKHDGATIAGSEYLIMYDQGLDRFTFTVYQGTTNSGTIAANNLGSPSTATWYYIVAWHDATANTVNIQVNNGTVDSVSYSNGINDTTTAFDIGALSNTGFAMDGRIDEVGLWKRTLTVQERTDLYNSGNGFTYPFITVSGYKSLLGVGQA